MAALVSIEFSALRDVFKNQRLGRKCQDAEIVEQ